MSVESASVCTTVIAIGLIFWYFHSIRIYNRFKYEEEGTLWVKEGDSNDDDTETSNKAYDEFAEPLRELVRLSRSHRSGSKSGERNGSTDLSIQNDEYDEFVMNASTRTPSRNGEKRSTASASSAGGRLSKKSQAGSLDGQGMQTGETKREKMFSYEGYLSKKESLSQSAFLSLVDSRAEKWSRLYFVLVCY